MAMKNLKFGPIGQLVLAVLAAFTATPARAQEGYTYSSFQGFSTSFFLIGGQYELYVNAHLPLAWMLSRQANHGSCIFGGTFQLVWPTHYAIQLGGPVQISLIPYRIDPTLPLPAGLYSLNIAPLTNCEWTFTVISTNQNAAGIAQVQMQKRTKAGLESSQTASLSDQVQFYAQYRTEHNAQAAVSGTVQIINDGKVVQTFPLIVSKDSVSKANMLYVGVQWEPSDAKYLGKNTAKFIVKIGSSEFTSTGEFTLTQ
jgi:hypothetical protein